MGALVMGYNRHDESVTSVFDYFRYAYSVIVAMESTMNGWRESGASMEARIRAHVASWRENATDALLTLPHCEGQSPNGKDRSSTLSTPENSSHTIDSVYHDSV